MEDDLQAAVAGKVVDLPQAEVQGIIDLLMTLYSVKSAFDEPLDEFAVEIAQSDSLSLPEEDRNRLRGYLARLMAADSLLVTSKAADILTANDNDYHGARIITETRYIFGDDITASPKAAVIAHMLKLICHGDAGNFHEIYVGLDTADLVELRDVVDRAITKSKTVNNTLEASGVRVIDRMLTSDER